MNIGSAMAVLTLAVMSCHAHAIGNLADVTVYDRAENRILPVYFHEGRYYVAGRPGNEYQIGVRNQQSGEIMAVVSVDGINAVSGETAHWSQTGYVFGANASYSIKGWRKSLQRVARFFFTELDNSYAARSGLDLVRHVRNHLDRFAQVIAAAFAGNDVFVDASAGQVVRLRQR